MHPSLWPIRLSGCFVMQITAIQSVQYIRAVSTETRHRSANLHFPTTTAGILESCSAQTFKKPTRCLNTTLILRNPGQRRLEIKIPFANQSIFSCYRVQNLLSEIMWYEVNRCQHLNRCNCVYEYYMISEISL